MKAILPILILIFSISDFAQTRRSRTEKKTDTAVRVEREELAPYKMVTGRIYNAPPVFFPPNFNILLVKAVLGDTVEKAAVRYGADPVDVANFNGLTSIEAPLSEGRIIKIPVKRLTLNNYLTGINELGTKPDQAKDGKVKAVTDYFNEYFNYTYTVRFIRWWPVLKRTFSSQEYWSVKVKLRVKNYSGRYIPTEHIFFISNNKIIGVKRIY